MTADRRQARAARRARRTRATRFCASPRCSTRAPSSSSRPTTTRACSRRSVASTAPPSSRSAATPRSWAARWVTSAAGSWSTPTTARSPTAYPIIGLWHSGGARLAEGVLSLHAVGRIFQVMTQASGVIPQISVVLGPAAGGAAYGPALTDVVILGPEGRIFVTGPDVVRSVTGEDVDMLRLGGPEPHGRRSGVVHILTDSEREALDRARTVASLLGAQGSLDADVRRGPRPRGAAPGVQEARLRRAPARRRRCSTRARCRSCTPAGPPTSSPRWAASAAARSAWSPTTRSASAAASTRSPRRRRPASCGCATRSASRSSSWWTSRATSPASGQEWDGVVRRGAKLLHAFGECVVPRVTLVTRKTYGGAYIAMNARSLGATRVFAWPGAEVAVMGAVAAIRILHRRRLAEVSPEIRPQVEAELAAEHERIAGGVDKAVEIGVVDEVVEPARTRERDRRGDAARDRHCRRTPRPARQHPALSSAAADPSGRSDHLVQPAHRSALAGVAEGLQLVVPRLAEQAGRSPAAAWCRPAPPSPRRP